MGVFRDTAVLDLDYDEDSKAQTDMNVVMNDSGGFIEVQGTAEGVAFSQQQLAEMMGLATNGIADLLRVQSMALAQ